MLVKNNWMRTEKRKAYDKKYGRERYLKEKAERRQAEKIFLYKLDVFCHKGTIYRKDMPMEHIFDS